MTKAISRREELRGAQERLATDLARWLPSTWPMTAEGAQPLIDSSLGALDQGIAAMRELPPLKSEAGNHEARTAAVRVLKRSPQR